MAPFNRPCARCVGHCFRMGPISDEALLELIRLHVCNGNSYDLATWLRGEGNHFTPGGCRYRDAVRLSTRLSRLREIGLVEWCGKAYGWRLVERPLGPRVAAPELRVREA